MDRAQLRGDIRCIVPSLQNAVRAGWKLTVATHIYADLEFLPLLDAVPYRHVDLRDKPTREILKFYADAGAVIGMRLHSCLIPFGFDRPVIPLITHNKLADWLMDVCNPHWGVELSDPLLDDLIAERLEKRETEPRMVDYLWWTTNGNMREIESIIHV
jgi:polysaccharide pyruvyl transferase WcaK-like protein